MNPGILTVKNVDTYKQTLWAPTKHHRGVTV
jgi:hypothetical protein